MSYWTVTYPARFGRERLVGVLRISLDFESSWLLLVSLRGCSPEWGMLQRALSFVAAKKGRKGFGVVWSCCLWVSCGLLELFVVVTVVIGWRLFGWHFAKKRVVGGGCFSGGF
ncbi:hypothetical protein KY285_033505 [Solanum tuberosum]|nr:hypothetical protein KY285_033505 [Solanum tuberosum]